MSILCGQASYLMQIYDGLLYCWRYWTLHYYFCWTLSVNGGWNHTLSLVQNMVTIWSGQKLSDYTNEFAKLQNSFKCYGKQNNPSLATKHHFKIRMLYQIWFYLIFENLYNQHWNKMILPKISITSLKHKNIILKHVYNV